MRDTRLYFHLRSVLAIAVAAASCLPASSQVVINEIHYDPEHQSIPAEFIELHNPKSRSVDLSGWSLADGIEFVFPAGTVMPGGSYLIVGEHPPTLTALYGVQALGPFQKQLANEGEQVTLRGRSGEIMDEVDYKVGFPWPLASGGTGASMELINADLDNNLGGSWRASLGPPTPGKANSVFSWQAPPQIRQVSHAPQQPASHGPIVITAKVTDPQGVRWVKLRYQIVKPGEYVPSRLPLNLEVLLANPEQRLMPNPQFESANWTELAMTDDGTYADVAAGDDVYTAVIPPQPSRTLVRYRIQAADSSGMFVQVPYADDASMNFACFVYDGVPAWKPAHETVHREGLGHVYSREVMNSLPVYFFITRRQDLLDAEKFIPPENLLARKKFNWEGAFVYDGVVYDHIRFRLRHGTSRYSPGKPSLSVEFNRGHHLQAKDDEGRPYPTQWRKLNLSRLFDSRGVFNFGLVEAMNSALWNLVGVPAPFTHWLHFRVLAQPAEAPATALGQYEGDFWGLYLALEDYDPRFLDAHQMPDGNLYKLKDQVFDPSELMCNQGKHSITNGADFMIIHNELRPGQSDEWLRTYVNWDKWYRYGVVQDAIRHDDYHPEDSHLKNRAWYFEPVEGNLLGRLWVLPWDTDSTWGPNWGGTGGYPRYAIFGDPEKTQFRIEYRNFIREFRDLIWNPPVISPMIDRFTGRIGEFVRADQDRWRIPLHDALAIKAMDMKYFAFVEWSGEAGDPVGTGGRASVLDELSRLEGDAEAIPYRPFIRSIGPPDFPVDQLLFETQPFEDPQGADTFAAMEWRVAEVRDPAAPADNPADPQLYEWNASWTSGLITTFQSRIVLPPESVQPGRAYRVRLRWSDTSGRWSHWSQPMEFKTTLPDASRELREHLRITEIMYHPRGGDAGEFVELTNLGPIPLDLRTLRIAGGIQFDFGTSAMNLLEPGGSVLVVENAIVFRSLYPANDLRIAGVYTGKLSNGGDRILLQDKLAGTILEIAYRDDWYPQTDGEGFSLVAALAETDPTVWNQRRGWRASDVSGGSPGQTDSNTLPSPDTVVINEIVSSKDPAESGWIELANVGNSPADLSGWYLSDDSADLQKYRLAEGTLLLPGEYLCLKGNETFEHPDAQKGFRLDGDSGVVYLSSAIDDEPGGYRSQAAHRLLSPGQSWGRNQIGGGHTDFVPMRYPTPGAPNAGPMIGPVVMSEVLFDSLETEAAEFIELFNLSDADIALAPASTNAPSTQLSWRLEGGVQFAFPPGTVIPARQFLVITGGDPRYVRERFRVPAGVGVIGPFEGRLNDDGEEIALAATQFDEQIGASCLIFEERIDFRFHARLPEPQRSVGTSLRRKHRSVYGNDPDNWAPASPSPGRLIPLDNDYDGLPDEWELSNGGQPDDPWDSSQDLDGDSQSLWDEYVAGTNPLDASDRLCLQITRTETHWRISLATRKATGAAYTGLIRRYMIQSRALESADWVPVTGWIIGDGQEIFFEDLAARPDEAQVFRALVELAPASQL